MYETVRDLWKRYCSKYSAEWSTEDPRGDLAAEVRERLTQLDLVLDHLKRAVGIFAGDPERLRRDVKWMTEAQPRFARDEMTQEEYLAGFSQKSQAEIEHEREAKDKIFFGFFCAWEVLPCGACSRSPQNFDRLKRYAIHTFAIAAQGVLNRMCKDMGITASQLTELIDAKPTSERKIMRIPQNFFKHGPSQNAKMEGHSSSYSRVYGASDDGLHVDVLRYF